MIQRKIHYCWFGNNPKPQSMLKCIASWKIFCPTYEIIEWNDENFDIEKCPLYVRQAYKAKKWAYVTDYARLKIVYENGGIYLDTDVELKKNLDKLLNNIAFFCFEDGLHINTGLGFGAVRKCKLLEELMDDYKEIPFILEDGSYDTETCPCRNTKVFLKHGLQQNDKMQILEHGIKILPSIYMCPIDYNTGKYRHSLKTISIHWFSSSWMDENQKKEQEKRKKIRKENERRDFWLHLPNRLAMQLLGKEKYEKWKNFIKGMK